MRARNNKKQERGITIIALIITIMVLFILAGVATSKMSEMRGIVKQSKNTAKFVTSAESKENIEKSETNSEAISYIMK